MTRVIPALLTLAAGMALAAEPFLLELPDSTNVSFPGGAVLRLPSGSQRTVRVLIATASFPEGGPARPEFAINGAYSRHTTEGVGPDTRLTAHTREARGLLTHDEDVISVSAGEGKRLQAEWTLIRWDKAYLESTKAATGGDTIAIRISRPAGGLVHSGGGALATIHLSGEVLGGRDAALTIDGDPVPPVPTMPGYHFDRDVALRQGRREVVLKATDKAGDETIVVLPVADSHVDEAK